MNACHCRQLLILLLSILGTTCCWCQEQDPFFINFGVNDGLPSSEVYDVHISNNGLLWLTSDRGICTYNGYEFQTYSTHDGLTNNTNFQIEEDHKGRLWFNGIDGSLSYFDSSGFHAYPFNEELQRQFDGTWIREFAFTKEGNLYGWGRDRRPACFLKIDSLSAPPQEVCLQPTKDSLESPTHLHSLPLPACRLNTANKKKPFHNLIAYPLGKRWVTGYQKELLVFDSLGRHVHTHWIGHTIDGLFVDRQQQLWLCTYGGLIHFPNGRLDLPPKQYFKDFTIPNMCQDSEGNYWIATIEQGILFVPSFDIHLIRPQLSQPAIEHVQAVYPLEKHILFGTSKGRVLALDSSFQVHWIQKAPQQNGQITQIGQIGQTVFMRDLAVTEKERGKFETYTFEQKYFLQQELIGDDMIKARHRGFFYYDATGREYESKYFEPTFQERITSIAEQDSQVVWIGALDNLYRFEKPNQLQIEYATEQKSFGRVNDLAIDPEGGLWIATIGNGLYVKKGQVYAHLGKRNGLSSDMVNKVFIDKNSSLWVATNKGLDQISYRFRKDSLDIIRIHNYSTQDGLPSNFIEDINFWNGQLWLATSQGIAYCKPHALKRLTQPPHTKFDAIVVNNKTVAPSLLQELSHTQNNVSIHYTAISHRKKKDASKHFYRYRFLKDRQAVDWTYTNDRSVHFNDLQAGQYTFEVMACNSEGQWHIPSAQLSFEIHPHFSNTIWFQLLLLLLAVAIGVLLLHNYTQRIQRKEKQKNLLQSARLRAKEAELAALRNQMNPHFIYNSLNAIQNYIFKKDVAKANFFLGKFSRLIRSSLEYSRLDYILVEQEIKFLKTYLEIESMRFHQKFSYHFDLDEALLEDRFLMPSLLIQPILENAVQHAFKDIDYPGELEISFQKAANENSVQICVQDNGVGLANATAAADATRTEGRSLGLDITRNRIELLRVDNQDQLSFKIIDRQAQSPGTKGLRIELIVPLKLYEYA
ncbi:MAG: histidine kinase [Bacteroidota bacterium]